MNICFLGCKDNMLISRVKDENPGCNIVVFDNVDEVNYMLEKADVVIVGRDPIVSQNVIDKLKACKLIIRNGIGYDNIDVHYAREKKIDVYNVSQYCIDDVAEHTFALLLNYSRNIYYHCHNHDSWGKSNVANIRLKGKRLGIVGLGKIGKRVAEIATSFGLNVIYYDPYVQFCPQYGKMQSLKEVIRECDFLTIHVPYTNETQKMINDDVLECAQGIVIINTSRGKVVDSCAVLNCLENGKVRAFLGDVLETEPPVKNALYNKLGDGYAIHITPHIAFDSDESENDLHRIVCDIIESYFSGLCVCIPVN